MTQTASNKEYNIDAPPPLVYPSEQEAEAALHDWMKRHKINVSRKRVKKNEDGTIVERGFACDRAGLPKNTRKLTDADRVRKMCRSKAINCKMRIKIVAVDSCQPSGAWQIAYTRDGSHTHNHPPSFDVRVHVAHRQRHARRTAQVELSQTDLVSAQSEAGVSTSQIYASILARDENSLIIPKDITNAKGKARSEILASSTSVEALFELLKAKNFHYSYEVDSANRLQYLMWAHPETTNLARYFMDILVIDCTYKTNKYRMPLFNAIIVTGMNSVLPLAQIWIPGEAEPDYTWALSKLRDLLVQNSIPMPRVILTDRELACTNATETVFPMAAKLLCQWHINRNVLAQAQKKIGQVDVQNAMVIGKKKKNTLATEKFMAKYYETIESDTEEEFNANSTGLRKLSSSMGKYLDKEWWPYKQKIVKCWTSRFSHFGTLSTSTVEGTHATMKRWLDNSRGDLLKVFMQLLPWWTGSARRISFQVAKDTNNIPILFRGDDRFSAVMQIISVWALTQTNDLWNKARKIVVHGLKRSSCDGSFRRIHGRPCLHELMQIIDSDGQLKLAPHHFDKHWWLPEASSARSDRVLEPSTLPKRGLKSRPPLHKAGHGEHSTRN